MIHEGFSLKIRINDNLIVDLFNEFLYKIVLSASVSILHYENIPVEVDKDTGKPLLSGKTKWDLSDNNSSENRENLRNKKTR